MAAISIDFFGNLNEEPVFWKEFLRLVKAERTKIYIISGLWSKDLAEKLESDGYIRKIHYNNIYSILSHLSNKGADVWFDENHDSWYSEKQGWWSAKAEICQKIGSQTHFDNDLRFAPEFGNIATRFVHTLNPDNRKLINRWHKDLKYNDWEDNFMCI